MNCLVFCVKTGAKIRKNIEISIICVLISLLGFFSRVFGYERRGSFGFFSAQDFFCSRGPLSFTEYLFNVFREYYFSGNKNVGKFAVSVGFGAEEVFGAFILFGDYARNFPVDCFCTVFGVWF